MDRRLLRPWRYAGIGLAGTALLLPIPLLLAKHPAHFPDHASIALFSIVTALAVAWAFGFAVLSERNADEFMREGAKVSWYWGGTLGLAMSAPIYVFVMMGGLHWLFPSSPVGKELARAFSMGYALPMVLQIAGMFLASAWWRISKR